MNAMKIMKCVSLRELNVHYYVKIDLRVELWVIYYCLKTELEITKQGTYTPIIICMPLVVIYKCMDNLSPFKQPTLFQLLLSLLCFHMISLKFLLLYDFFYLSLNYI